MTTPDINHSENQRGWEYARIGDYHRNPDPNWSYTPTYLRKMKFVRAWLDRRGPEEQILDAGCGEGILVEDYQAKGYHITGLDLNYSSSFVQQGNILAPPFPDASFDGILLLDVFEHLTFADQPTALKVLQRLLKPNGWLLLSIPNLAHLNSRFRLFFRGMLDRTDRDIDHPGERPYRENMAILRAHGFEVVQQKGITLTMPWVYRRVICRHPARYRWLHDVLEPFARPPWAMCNIFVCRREVK